MSKPLNRPQLKRLRTLVEGPAGCPSCGEEVPRELDVCPCDGDGVVVEPISHEFINGPPFADRETVAGLLAVIDDLKRTIALHKPGYGHLPEGWKWNVIDQREAEYRSDEQRRTVTVYLRRGSLYIVEESDPPEPETETEPWEQSSDVPASVIIAVLAKGGLVRQE